MSKVTQAVVALVFVLSVGHVGHAYVVQVPLAQTKHTLLSMKDSGTRHIKIRAASLTSISDQSPVLMIFNDSGGNDCVSYMLPEALWTAHTDSHGRLSFSYRDRMLSVSPVRSADFLRRSELRFSLTSTTGQPIDYTLDEATQSRVAMTFTFPIGKVCGSDLGSAQCSSDADCGGSPGSCQDSVEEECAEFASPIVDKPGKFVSRTIVPSMMCPAVPPGC